MSNGGTQDQGPANPTNPAQAKPKPKRAAPKIGDLRAKKEELEKKVQNLEKCFGEVKEALRKESIRENHVTEDVAQIRDKAVEDATPWYRNFLVILVVVAAIAAAIGFGFLNHDPSEANPPATGQTAPNADSDRIEIPKFKPEYPLD